MAAEPLSVVVIVIDTLRADRLGCYGYRRPTSPNIDAFAREAILFERARSTSGTTLPAHVSLFTGTNPSRHGVRGNFRYFHIPVPSDGRMRLAAQMFGRLGYQTAAFVSSPAVAAETGLGAGFEIYREAPSGELANAETTVDRVLDWLPEGEHRPFFLFVHLVDPHSPYEPPEPHRSALRADGVLNRFLQERAIANWRTRIGVNEAYDGEIRYTDEHVGRLLDAIRKRGLYERAAIVLTADHGEGLGQHGWLYHTRVYEEQLAVPLIVRLPGQAPRRVPALVSLIDVLPTLAAQLQLPLDAGERAQFEGIDVLGSQVREYAFAERVPHHQNDPDTSEHFALVGREWKYFHRPGGRDQLFQIARDPFETRDLSEAQPEIAKAMRAEVERILASYQGAAEVEAPAPAEIPESARERLRQLGYE